MRANVAYERDSTEFAPQPSLLRRRLGLGRRRVPDPVARGGEHREDDAGECPHRDGQRHDHLLLLLQQRRVEALHRVGVGQQRHRGEHGHGEGGVHEVRQPQPVPGEVPPPALRAVVVGERQHAARRHEAVLDLAVRARVAVGEGRERAEEGEEREEDGRGHLVPEVAVARVGHDRVEHPVQDDRRRRQQLQHVGDALERRVRHAPDNRVPPPGLACAAGFCRQRLQLLFDAFLHSLSSYWLLSVVCVVLLAYEFQMAVAYGMAARRVRIYSLLLGVNKNEVQKEVACGSVVVCFNLVVNR
jgi:hypothetical protein